LERGELLVVAAAWVLHAINNAAPARCETCSLQITHLIVLSNHLVAIYSTPYMGSLRAAAAAGGGGGAMVSIPTVDAEEACVLLSSSTHHYLDVRYTISY
jgi:hypothetical protein